MAGIVLLFSPQANSPKAVRLVHEVVVLVEEFPVVEAQLPPFKLRINKTAVFAPPRISPETKVKVGL